MTEKRLICPISYNQIPDQSLYSPEGLKQLDRKLIKLCLLSYTTQELHKEISLRANKISIQGVQPKLSARFNSTKKSFELVNKRATYILKPQHPLYSEVPENESLSMKLGETIGIEMPVFGMIYGSDMALTYFIKRFDRKGHKTKFAVEDFSQLTQKTRATKYNATMEQVITVVDSYCTFPLIEKVKLFKRTLFNFLIGNEDMHLKNFSLITREDKIELAPAYDFLNTTIILENTKEEMALALRGKKSNFKKDTLIDYFAKERLRLNQNSIKDVLDMIESHYKNWESMIKGSFLSDENKEKYLSLVNVRWARLFQ
ncbi:MAG: HipA domain-containing protein [bacterium]|nr:HipA domain-containing protein [bacterium]MBU1918629.1 HipA domain-containing protein [bacterium]